MTQRVQRMIVGIILCALLGATLPPASLVYAQTNQPAAGETPSVYLPLIAAPPGPPDFAITSPADGLTVSGVTFFSVQPVDLTNVTKVSFQAGGANLGTDTNGADGFQVFLDAGPLPAGPIQLTATATGPTGLTQKKSLTVTIVPKAPSSATVSSGGATLGTASGNTIIVPPGAVQGNATISVQDKTQAQVTQEKGINWDALGVTFLGAIDVQTSAPISKPLGVSSVGFGNRVQPGQALVTYQILPDADGDGVGELVVVNGANLAPNGTIVSSPVPQIVVNSLAARTKGRVQAAGPMAGLSGLPGTTLTIRASGFNPASARGNVAVFRSSVNGEVFELPGLVRADGSDPTLQVFSTVIPPLTPGAATLTLRNESSLAVAGPFAITIEPSAALSKPAATMIQEFLTNSISFMQKAPTGTPEEATQQSQIVAQLTQVRDNFNGLIKDGVPPELAPLLDKIATVLQNSDVYSVGALQAASGFARTDFNEGRFTDGLNMLWGLAGILGALAAIPGAAPAFVGFAVGFGVVISAAVVLYYACRFIRGGNCFGDPTPPPPPPACTPAQSGGGGTTGMGAAPPPGGNGCGNVAGGGGGSVRSAGRTGLAAGRYTIKVFPQAGGRALTPFTGSTDPGGYFFIPLIPQGEPFKAVAVDQVTGASTTSEGVGPATGKSSLMFFDFSNAQGNRFAISIGDTISNGVPGPGAGNIEGVGGLDIYTFNAAPGQQIYVNLLSHVPALNSVDWELADSTGAKLFSACLGCSEPGVVTLQQGGLYTLRVGIGNNTGTGTYSFKLWNVPPPQRFNIAIGDTISNGVPGPGAGNIETPGVKDIYNFNAVAGQQIYVNLLTRAPGTTYVDWRLVDSTGAKLFDTCLGCGEPGVVTLAQGGVYTLTLGTDRDLDNGAYSFKLWNVPPPQRFNIAIGETVANGVPGAGAGNIETPGVKDIYTFNATAGQQIYVNLLSHAPGTTYVDWRLVDSTGAKLFDTCLGCGEPGVVTLAQGGVYTLTLGTDRDPDNGAYSFKLWDVPPPQHFAIAIGDTVSNGVPGVGAGNIETPGVKDIYTFNATAGQKVKVTLLNRDSGTTYIDWRLVDSTGAKLFDTCLGCGAPDALTLAQGGVYTLTVGTDRDPDIGAYQFQITPQ